MISTLSRSKVFSPGVRKSSEGELEVYDSLAQVQHWDDMELIWRHVYSEMKAWNSAARWLCLASSRNQVNAEEHPVLLTEVGLMCLTDKHHHAGSCSYSSTNDYVLDVEQTCYLLLSCCY